MIDLKKLEKDINNLLENTTDEELRNWIDSKTKSKPMKKTKEQLAAELHPYIGGSHQDVVNITNREIVDRDKCNFIAGYDAALQNINLGNIDVIEKEPVRFIMNFALRLDKEQFQSLSKWLNSYIDWDEIEKKLEKWTDNYINGVHVCPTPKSVFDFIKSKLQ